MQHTEKLPKNATRLLFVCFVRFARSTHHSELFDAKDTKKRKKPAFSHARSQASVENAVAGGAQRD